VCGRLHVVTSGCDKHTALVCLLLRCRSVSHACTHFNVTIKIPCSFVESCSQGELQIETVLGGGGGKNSTTVKSAVGAKCQAFPYACARLTDNSRVSSLNSWPSLFYFYFTLSSFFFCLVFITLCFLCSFVTFTLLILLYLSYYFLSDLSHPVLIAGCQHAQILVHPLAAAT
jgi:hypothetical protein